MPLPVFDNAAYEALLAKRRQQDRDILSREGSVIEGQYAAVPLETNLIQARRRASGARLGTIGAEASLIPIERGINAQQGRVLDAETVQLAGTRGLIGLAQQQAGAQAQDLAQIRGARDNVADKVAVAQAGLAEGVEDSRLYGRLGVAAPVSVDVPMGKEGSLGLGTRASLRTQEEIVRGQVADREADRAATLKNAQLAVQMSGTNVTEAELMARRLGLTLADAKLMVDEAQTREQLAGVDVTNAGLDTQEQDIELKRLGLGVESEKQFRSLSDLELNDMKAPGDQGYQMYTDPVTMERSWRTPAEADQLQHDYEVSLTRQRLPESISLAREREAAQAKEEGLGGLTVTNALSMLAQGSLPSGVSAEAILKSLVQVHHYDPNTAFDLVAQAQAKRNTLAFQSFDDSDFVQFLLPGAQKTGSQDSSQPDPLNTLISQVRTGLEAKYPNNPQTVQIKLIQYVNAAKALAAKIKDEKTGLSR